MSEGRPTKYRAQYNKIAESLALLGATDKEIADALEISESTFYEWKKEYPKFTAALKKGKLNADGKVAASLYKRAIGYKFKEVTYEKVGEKEELEAEPDSQTTKEVFRKRVVLKEIPPDVIAQIFWMKNRRSKPDAGGQRWADKHEMDHTSRGDKLGSVPVVVIQNPHDDAPE